MKVLVFTPHNDDEVLGVGGTIAKLSRAGHEVCVCEVTGVESNDFFRKVKVEAISAHKILGVKKTFFLGSPVIELKHESVITLNSKIREVVREVQPNIVFIPHKGDMHNDHLEVAQSAMVALRPHENPQLKAIYSYETLSETEWSIPSVENAFIPNVWVDISETIDIKIEAMSCFQSQIQEFPHPRSLKAIRSLSEFRGSTICVNNAESFMLIRSIF